MSARSCMILAALLAGAAASAREIPIQGTYVSPIGGFVCSGYPLGAEVEESFGPHGGTVRISDPARQVRFDIEEFSPTLDSDALREKQDLLSEGYLMQNLMPLVRSVRPAAQLLDAKAVTLTHPPSLSGLRVFQSAILMDEKTIRGQIQYTNGRFMLTASALNRGPLYGDESRQIRDIYQELLLGLRWCRFPP